MAINPNTAHDNANAIVCACSGGGKSQLIGQRLIPKGAGDRVLLWDPDQDYKATRYTGRAEYARAVAAAVRGRKGFRLAFSGDGSVANFQWWCRLVWLVLDGNKKTHVIIEELANVSPSSGKALPEFGTLLRQGRKYGAVLIMATQRGTEISKTAWTQVQHRYIGQQEANDRKRLAIEADIQPAEIAALNPMQFFYKRSGAQAPEKITLKPRKIN